LLTPREEKEIRALHIRRHRDRGGRFLAEGLRVVEDLLDSDLETRLVVTSSALEDADRGRELLETIHRQGVAHRIVADRDFAALAATDQPQGALAVAEAREWRLDDLGDGGAPILLLDAVQDPGNFGTMVRTAEALGVAGVIALRGTVDTWNPKAVRAAAGSSFRHPVVRSGWDEASEWLRGHGYDILAAAVGGDDARGRSGRRVGVVVGNEGAGISEDILQAVTGMIGIPLAGRTESLNVAAAAAILLYELTR
jgi:TrmH family RNA methyltransferase